MSQSFRIHPPLGSLRPTTTTTIAPSDSSRKFSVRFFNSLSFSGRFPLSSVSSSREIPRFHGKFPVLRNEGSLQELDDSPVSIDLQSISSETEFDRVLAEAQQLDEAVVVVWMANWCRKCIYLKPKLEKLAAEYYPRLRFYCVDVNAVPHKLVARAGVTKMPTIQLWKGGEKRAEIIGGHKAYIVINEVREMIENERNV